MSCFRSMLACVMTMSGVVMGSEKQGSNVQAVSGTAGLVAFWDFNYTEGGSWGSFHDPALPVSSYPLHLKRIGDPADYSVSSWPYTDADSDVLFDDSGPFGTAVRFNKGYIYGAVARKDFDRTLLDLHGKQPFTIIAWLKFVGHRHMVAGIWDEGGWDKYAGRRQIALFGGLFRQKGVIMHVSATGAASYPQSVAKGSQYARLRAIDGRPFEDDQWISMAAVYDPDRCEVIAYLNGVKTPLALSDPIAEDVFQYAEQQPANPFRFSLPIYSPRNFTVKYNGIDLSTSKIREHRLQVDLDERALAYEQEGQVEVPHQRFRITFDVLRDGQSVFSQPVTFPAIHGQVCSMPANADFRAGDVVWTALESEENGAWTPVGTIVKREIQEGAPFTFGRALGLGNEDPGHGSQLYVDGVAVFNRILNDQELMSLSFVE